MTTTPGTAGTPIAHPTGIHHVRLSVTDVVRSKDFYRTVFGAEPVVDETGALSDPAAVDDPERLYGGCVFACGQQRLGLRPVAAAPGETFQATRVGLDHVSFAVGSREELVTAAARLAEAGIPHGEVTELPAHAIVILSLQDPDDINLELTAPLEP
ncbi:VOC family protein [Quadrisphaera sp. DSM 44207]|uniref:VOC family protein n=1 Tax=Quadrisphaera sp. DSM 44207 TaxID=1881057 RepID=UPI00087F6194|nr:VOC family protein [Quadrisphaera sp. DSM 44207]SDQ18533.1 Catechol 2,3-dioxygenase [Quadrisphaera sp. DSM 44207]